MSIAKQFFSFSEWTPVKVLQAIVYGSLILYFGRDILIPLSFAALISFVLYPACRWLEDRGVGRLAAILIAVGFLIIAGVLLLGLLVGQFFSFVEEWPALLPKISRSLSELSHFLADTFGISLDQQRSLLARMSQSSGSDLVRLIRSAIAASAGPVVLLLLIPVYSVLILYYRHQWVRILYRLFPGESTDNLRGIVTLTI